MKRIVLIITLSIVAGVAAWGQTKAETKLYNKTLKKPSIAAYDKFLKKYPSSVYAADITARKDTILSITPYSEAQAAEILAAMLPQGAQLRAFPQRKDAIDRIYGVCITSDSLSKDQIGLYAIEDKGGKWEFTSAYATQGFESQDFSTKEFVGQTQNFQLRGAKYYRLSYLITSPDEKTQSLVEVSYCPEQDSYTELAFSGKNIRSSSDTLAYKIEGRTNELFVSGMNLPDRQLMLQALRDNPALSFIPDDIYFTDNAIEWWLSNNPDALTTAKSVKMNKLQEESSLVKDLAVAKYKANNKKYTAALFETRGYTVIVVYQKANGEYMLAWAEPECKNKRTDRLLNSISFVDENNLRMSYYHGRRSFRYDLNLTSKTVRR